MIIGAQRRAPLRHFAAAFAAAWSASRFARAAMPRPGKVVGGTELRGESGQVVAGGGCGKMVAE